MKFNLIQNKNKYLNDNDENEYPKNHSNYLFDSSIIKNRPFLDRPGKIKYAKKHASADRPLHKIRNFTKETDFCQCCNLPCETKNIIEPFKICDSIDNFSEGGLGISLYFYYFRYSIICLCIIFILLALPFIIFNKYYSNELSRACNKNNNSQNISICNKYVEDSEFYNYTFIISIPFSSDTVSAYSDYAVKTTGTDKNVKKTIIHYGVLNLFCTITLFVINIYFLILLKQKIYKEKNINCSPSDFTLFLSNLYNTLDYYDDECISKKKFIYDNKDNFENFVSFLKNKIIYTKKTKNKSKNIYDINFCYKLKDFMISEKQVQKVNYKLLQIVNNSKQKKLNIKYGLYGEKRKYFELFCGCVCKKGISIKKLLKHREINQRKIDFLLKNSKVLTKYNFAGAIFLTFNTIQQKEEYYSMYPHYIMDKIILFFKESKYYFCWCFVNEKSKKKFLRKSKIKISLAPEPEDVIWENIEYDIWFRIKRSLIIYSFTILLLLISFLIVLSLTYFKEYLIKHKLSSFFVKYGISLLITITISLLNEIFYYLLEILTKKEKLISMTNYYLSFSFKLTFFTFISSGIVPLVSNLIENGTGNNENLVDNMLIIFLVNSFLTPVLWTFDIQHIYNKIKICLLERKKNPDKEHNMTQRELNKLYELIDMKISYKYSYIAKTLLLSLFYVPIFPFGIIISLIGFLIGYILELYNFTHLYKRPEMINEKICLFYIEYFVVNIFIFCLGILIFMERIFSSDIWIIFNLVIFGILSFVPYTKFIKCHCFTISNPFINNDTNYEDVYFSFYNDYQRQNPITKIDGLKNYINKLRINGYISQKVYNFSYMNIDNINVMELYYRSKMNRNIVQSQVALANINNSYKNSLQNKKSIKNKKQLSNAYSMLNRSSTIYDEQLTNLLKQSIYKQRFGNNLDELNKILNNKNIFNGNNTEIISNNNSNKSDENKDDELKSEGVIEKNKDFILNQYKFPFLLNISHNMGNAGDLGIINESKNNNGKKILNGIEEVPELTENGNDSEQNEIIRDKNYYGVDYDIYSKKSSFSSSNSSSKKKNINIKIEMKDLSKKNENKDNNNNKYKKGYNYEMSSFSEEKDKINILNNKNQKEKESESDDDKELKEYFLNLTKNNYDGDNDSDYYDDYD